MIYNAILRSNIKMSLARFLLTPCTMNNYLTRRVLVLGLCFVSVWLSACDGNSGNDNAPATVDQAPIVNVPQAIGDNDGNNDAQLNTASDSNNSDTGSVTAPIIAGGTVPLPTGGSSNEGDRSSDPLSGGDTGGGTTGGGDTGGGTTGGGDTGSGTTGGGDTGSGTNTGSGTDTTPGGDITVTPISGCAPAALNWGSTCSANVAAGALGEELPVVDAAAPDTGVAIAFCNTNGQWSISPDKPAPCSSNSLPADTNPTCAAQTLVWEVNGIRCEGVASAGLGGEERKISTAEGLNTIGSAEYTCHDDGTPAWEATTAGKLCITRGCASQTVQWTVNGNTCQGKINATSSAQTTTVAAADNPANQAEFTCDTASFTWKLSDSTQLTCTAPEPTAVKDVVIDNSFTCPAESRGWKSGQCAAEMPSMPGGSLYQAASSATGTSGTATFSCNKNNNNNNTGQWSVLGNSTCFTTMCPEQLPIWSGTEHTCITATTVGDPAQRAAGLSVTVASQESAHNTATFVCDPETLAWRTTASACVAPAAMQCKSTMVSWTDQSTGATCTGPTPQGAVSGTAVDISDITGATVGKASAQCEAKSLKWTIGKLAQCERVQCPEAELTWTSHGNKCATQVGKRPAGTTIRATNSISQYTGTAEFACHAHPETQLPRWTLQRANSCHPKAVVDSRTCPAQSVQWTRDGVTCNSRITETREPGADTIVVVDADGPAMGGARFRCDDEGHFAELSGVCESEKPLVNRSTPSAGTIHTIPTEEAMGAQKSAAAQAIADALKQQGTQLDQPISQPTPICTALFHTWSENEYECTTGTRPKNITVGSGQSVRLEDSTGPTVGSAVLTCEPTGQLKIVQKSCGPINIKTTGISIPVIEQAAQIDLNLLDPNLQHLRTQDGRTIVGKPVAVKNSLNNNIEVFAVTKNTDNIMQIAHWWFDHEKGWGNSAKAEYFANANFSVQFDPVSLYNPLSKTMDAYACTSNGLYRWYSTGGQWSAPQMISGSACNSTPAIDIALDQQSIQLVAASTPISTAQWPSASQVALNNYRHLIGLRTSNGTTWSNNTAALKLGTLRAWKGGALSLRHAVNGTDLFLYFRGYQSNTQEYSSTDHQRLGQTSTQHQYPTAVLSNTAAPSMGQTDGYDAASPATLAQCNAFFEYRDINASHIPRLRAFTQTQNVTNFRFDWVNPVPGKSSSYHELNFSLPASEHPCPLFIRNAGDQVLVLDTPNDAAHLTTHTLKFGDFAYPEEFTQPYKKYLCANNTCPSATHINGVLQSYPANWIDHFGADNSALVRFGNTSGQWSPLDKSASKIGAFSVTKDGTHLVHWMLDAYTPPSNN